MRKSIFIALCVAVLIMGVFQACQKPDEWDAETRNEWYSGGKQTVFNRGVGAYSMMFPEISPINDFRHEVGDLAFEAKFVTGGVLNPGLGPIYNSVSCTSCHINDGRGTPIGPGTNMISLLFRLSLPGEDEHGGPVAVPGYGTQLQQNAIFGVTPEAKVNISYTEIPGTYPDGTSYSLRQPLYSFSNAYLPMPAAMQFSPRIAPPVFGLGLIEAISEQTILEHEDEFDRDGDGISGRANYVWDVVNQRTTLGRFGWKANQPSLLQQTAGAFQEDMGITNFVFPQESAHGQSQANGLYTATHDLSDSLLHAVTFYVQTLAVPARRNADAESVIAGKKIFNRIGCSSCHRPMMKTAVNVSFPEVSHQIIFPYSDFLLHDMGEGLADYRSDYKANGYEWRTPPLWGIGLTSIVNGHNNYLHDGRARSLEEAILWHGGEASQANESFKNLSQAERNQLLLFLRSL